MRPWIRVTDGDTLQTDCEAGGEAPDAEAAARIASLAISRRLLDLFIASHSLPLTHISNVTH